MAERSQGELLAGHLAWLNTTISQMGTREEKEHVELESQEPSRQVFRR